MTALIPKEPEKLEFPPARNCSIYERSICGALARWKRQLFRFFGYEQSYFTKEELSQAKKAQIPSHVAIIMDGNRRWEAIRGVVFSGHNSGADVVLRVVGAAKELGIKTITVYAFSTENWTRSSREVDHVFSLVEKSLIQQLPKMIEEGVRLGTIGDVSKLPPSLQRTLEEFKKQTEHCSKINLVLALNYGARDEITRAVRSLAECVHAGTLKPQEIDEKLIENSLDTAPWGDPELLIRTGGMVRLSNYLLWQSSYTELCFLDVLWPDFAPSHLLNAILSYQKRERRWGT